MKRKSCVKSAVNNKTFLKKLKRDDSESETDVKQYPVRRTSFKSTMMILSTIFKTYTLSDQHLALLRQSPFWRIMEPFATNRITEKEVKNLKKNDQAIINILKTYSDVKDSFFIGGRWLRIRRIDLQLIFGIVSGDRAVSLDRIERPTNSIIANLCGPGKQLAHKMLTDALVAVLKLEQNEQNNLSVAQLVILVLISSLFVPSSTAYLRWSVMKCVEDWNEINSYDWATFIRDDFVSKLNKMKKGEEGLCKGFVPLVLV